MDEEEPSCRLNKLDVYLGLGNLEDTNMKNIPSDMGKVRDEWIADLLVVHGGLESGSISKIEREPMGEGIGQVGEFCKLVVTSNQDERFSYFLKLRAPVEGMHQVALRYKMYENEVRFYQELAKTLDVRTPKVVFADYDPETENVALLMEFMDGWHSPDQISGASHHQACLAIQEIPKISAPYWNRTKEIPWVATMKTDHFWSSIQDVKACEDIFYDRFGGDLSISRTEFGNLVDSWSRVLTELSEGLLTLTHYDYRIENLFFSAGEDRVAVIDWQLMACVKPSWDFAYLIGTNIDTSIRRENQQEYIQLYLDGLRQRGIDYSERQLREDMKWTLLGLSVIPVIGGSNFDVDNDRSFELYRMISKRHFETVCDYDALSALS